jgi:hypothetical protein
MAIASRAINRERAMTPELTFSMGALVRVKPRSLRKGALQGPTARAKFDRAALANFSETEAPGQSAPDSDVAGCQADSYRDENIIISGLHRILAYCWIIADEQKSFPLDCSNII